MKLTLREENGATVERLLREVSDLKTALDEHAIVAITDPRGSIAFVNEQFCAISQYSRAELIGQNHRIINSGYHPPEFFRDLWGTIGRGRVWKGEIRNRAKDGSFYWVSTTIVPFVDPDGKPHQYVSIRTDITQQKRVEEEVRKLNAELADRVRERTAQLEAANRELEAFSYSVSHDLRAPIRHIGGFLSLLNKSAGPVLSETDRHYLAQISDATRRMGGLIDNLLEFSRMARAELRRCRVELDSLVDEVIRDLAPEIGSRDIVWKKSCISAVEGDRLLLRQVIYNLLSNAVKYTRPRKQAVIEIGELDRVSQEVVVYIRDNGVGFDMRYADKLFGVFQRLHLDDDFEGTGIGLANVKRIIARHGGRAWAEGEVDRGATFYFSIPADPPGFPGRHPANAIDGLINHSQNT